MPGSNQSKPSHEKARSGFFACSKQRRQRRFRAHQVIATLAGLPQIHRINLAGLVCCTVHRLAITARGQIDFAEGIALNLSTGGDPHELQDAAFAHQRLGDVVPARLGLHREDHPKRRLMRLSHTVARCHSCRAVKVVVAVALAQDRIELLRSAINLKKESLQLRCFKLDEAIGFISRRCVES